MKITKKINTTLIFLLFSVSVIGQNKELSLPPHLDTNKEQYPEKIEMPNCIKFELIQMSQDSLFDEIYRFESEGQIIEIRRIDSIISGQVINYVYEYKEHDTEFSHPIVSKSLLSSDTSFLIYKELRIFDSVPDMRRIGGWYIGHDGVSCKVEKSTKTSYFLKGYWTPSVQSESVRFKTDLIAFIDFIQTLDTVERSSREFYEALKPGAYTNTGFDILLIPERKRKKNKYR